MPELAQCPRCGEYFDPRGLPSHKGSNPCIATQSQKKQKRKGRKEIAHSTGKALERRGYPVYWANRWHPGSRGRSGTWTEIPYVDEKMYRINQLTHGHNKRWDVIEKCIEDESMMASIIMKNKLDKYWSDD